MLHILGKDSTTNIVPVPDKASIQPNAIDLRLQQVFELKGSEFLLEENNKANRVRLPIEDSNGWYKLVPGAYEIVLGTTQDKTETIITMGEDEAGFVIPRSSLMRNGIFLTSGLYDSGYKGPLHACLHITTGNFKVAKYTRLGQFLLFKAEALHMYNGQYNAR